MKNDIVYKIQKLLIQEGNLNFTITQKWESVSDRSIYSDGQEFNIVKLGLPVIEIKFD